MRSHCPFTIGRDKAQTLGRGHGLADKHSGYITTPHGKGFLVVFSGNVIADNPYKSAGNTKPGQGKGGIPGTAAR